LKLSTTTFQLYSSQIQTREDVNLLQLTDCHLFSSVDAKLLGLATEASLQAVVEDVQKQMEFDCILATGDISQDSSVEAYSRFSDYLLKLKKPSFWIPGNHDDPKQMENSLQGKNIYPHKRIIVNRWQIILLDSSLKNKVHGFLSEQTLDFLHQSLADKPDLNALIVLHHHPYKVGSRWLDSIGLRNSAEFMALLALHQQVKGVLWGHVHQQFDKTISGVRLMSTPSTCVQFEPGSEDFEAGRQAPGYRWLTLKPDGRIETKVFRIESQPFEVDYNIKGY